MNSVLLKKGDAVRIGTILCLAMIGFAGVASAASTPISSCTTISASGNFIVTKDLTTSGDCIVIAPGISKVGIDLDKHTLTGDGSTGGGITDDGKGASHIVIANGKITKFLNGILLTSTGTSYGSYVTVDKINASNNKRDGAELGSFVNTVTNSTFDNNGAEGLAIDDCCNTIGKVVANGNATNGIDTVGCCSLVTDSQAMNNAAGAGVIANGCCSLLANMKVVGNGGDGIEANDCCNLVSNSTVKSNKSVGILATGCCNGVDGSTVEKNGSDGGNLSGCCNLVNQSSAEKNGGDGFALDRAAVRAGFDIVTGSKA